MTGQLMTQIIFPFARNSGACTVPDIPEAYTTHWLVYAGNGSLRFPSPYPNSRILLINSDYRPDFAPPDHNRFRRHNYQRCGHSSY